jgi:hypothetical protein
MILELGDWVNFSVASIPLAEVVQRQFQLNRRDEFLKAFVQDAVNRIMVLVKN